MSKTKPARVQRLSVQNYAVGARYRYGVGVIQLVATKRIPDMRRMYSDLVSASRLQNKAAGEETVVLLYYLVMRDRPVAVGRNRSFHSAADTLDRLVYYADALARKLALAKRDVLSMDMRRRKHAVRKLIFGDYHKPRSIPIKTVDRAVNEVAPYEG